MSDSSPFIDAFVQPSFGLKRCWIVYTLQQGFEDGEIYVARSSTGTPDSWVDVNEIPFRPGDIIEDDENWQGRTFAAAYYRIVLVHQGKDYISPVISTFGRLSRMEYFGVRQILANSLLELKVASGLEILHIIPKTSGQVAQGIFDPDTLQRISAEACAAAGISLDQSAPYGYHTPVRSWMRIASAARRQEEISQTGLPSATTERVAVQLLAFPTPHVGDVLVHAASDRRYVITGDIAMDAYRGLAPVGFNVTAELLPRSDPRYRLTLL